MTDHVRYYNEGHSNTPDGLSEATGWQTEAELAAGIAALQATTADGDTITVYFKRQATAPLNDWFTTDSMALSSASPAVVQVIFEGYNVTPGDGGDAGVDNFYQHNGRIEVSRLILRYWDIFDTQNSSAAQMLTVTADGLVEHCRIVATCSGSGVIHAATIRAGTIRNCYIESKGASSSSSSCFALWDQSSGTVCAYHNVIKGTAYFRPRYRGSAYIGNLIMGGEAGSRTRDYAVSIGQFVVDYDIGCEGCIFVNNIVYDSPADAIRFRNGIADSNGLDCQPVFLNLIIDTCGGYVFANGQGSNATTWFPNVANCFYRGAALGTNDANTKLVNAELALLSSSPFVNPAGNDFTLDPASAGGLEILAGRPSSWADYGYTNPAIIAGVDQQAGAGGGGSTPRASIY